MFQKEVDNEERAWCRCGTSVAPNTTALRKHLVSKRHKKDTWAADAVADEKQTKLTSAGFTCAKKGQRSSATVNIVSIRMMIAKRLPLCFLTGPAWALFMKLVGVRNFVPPAPPTVRRYLVEWEAFCKNTIKADMRNAVGGISVTTDMWSSAAHVGYGAVTVR